MNKISVVLADDHPVYVDGLVRVFAETPDLKVIAVAANGEEALKAIRELQPDVAILDLRMPKKTGLDVLLALQSLELKTRVMLLTGSDERNEIFKAVAAGVTGYLLKNADWDDLAESVRRVVAGETVIAPEVVTILASQIRTNFSDAAINFTPRELEVLELSNRSITEIATALDLRPNTVKVHLQRVYRKLGVSTKAQAVVEAMRRGILK